MDIEIFIMQMFSPQHSRKLASYFCLFFNKRSLIDSNTESYATIFFEETKDSFFPIWQCELQFIVGIKTMKLISVNFIVITGNLRCSQIIKRWNQAFKEWVLNILLNVWKFVTEFYHLRIKYANNICQHAVTKMFHLERVDSLYAALVRLALVCHELRLC